MKLTFNGSPLPMPPEGSPNVDTRQACQCGETRVRGTGIHEEDDRFYVSTAMCCRCGSDRGKLKVAADTLFGLEEDRAVLHGRCRVY